MSKNSLQLQQLDRRLAPLAALQTIPVPPEGWLKSIRQAIGMSMRQLGNKLSVTRQSIMDMERREKNGSITLNALKEAAESLGTQFVYGFVPKENSFEDMVDNKATEVATKIVLRAAHTMKLENQGNSDSRIQKAIAEKAQEIKSRSLKNLWD